MTLTDLEFKAEDSKDPDFDKQPKITIREANRLLRERLAPLMVELEELRKLKDAVEKAPKVWVKLPTDFHPQHKVNGMVSTEPVEGWAKAIVVGEEK